MTEMIEDDIVRRVAVALYEGRMSRLAQVPIPFEHWPEEYRDCYYDDARAAILAIRAEGREDCMEESLHHIQSWCDAYPIDVFPEPDMEAIKQKLGDGPMAALHAHWARHLLRGIAKHARKGLQRSTYRCEFCGSEQAGPDPAFCRRDGCFQPHRASGVMRLVHETPRDPKA